MRFRNIRKWDNPTNSASLLYFAQILEEMLFDYSLDTYKTSIMNTGLLCIESIQTIDEVEAGNIKAPNINHVLAELCANLERDIVAQALIPLPYSSYFPTLKNPKTPVKEIRSVVELLAIQLTQSKYRSKNEEMLEDSIIRNAAPSEIRRLARSYLTTLITIGYSQKYILEMSKDFFYFGQNRISDNNVIKDFLSIFPKEKIEFVVTFRVEDIFKDAADSFSHLGIQVTTQIPEPLNFKDYPAFLPVGNKLFAIANKIAACDPYSARAHAENKLKLCATFLSLFHHKEDPSWLPECVVYNSTDNSYKLVKRPINPMHKCEDLIQPKASHKLKLFMNDFSLEKSSFYKFVRSAQLHSMALRSNSDENQILNLWISLESLVPSETKSDDSSNIEHIVNSLIPFLNEFYIQRLLNNLLKDLLLWNKSLVIKSLRPIQGKRLIDKLAMLLSLPEYNEARNSLEASFKDFHLLKDRFNYFKNLLSSPSPIVEALKAHKMRLEWQIRRIYRTRNIIVHSGKSLPYTQQLIEHTHDYLDIVLSRLVELASTPKSIRSVAQGFKFVELRYTTYLNRLEQRGLTFDQSNIHELLFDY